MGDNYIYTLTDPKTNKVIYVGATCNPQERIKQHMARRRTDRNQRLQDAINAMYQEGVEPIMTILETVEKRERRKREIHWIIDHLERGVDLYNMNGVSCRGKNIGLEAIKHRGVWKPISATVRPDQKESIDRMMEETGDNRSEVVRRIIDAGLASMKSN